MLLDDGEKDDNERINERPSQPIFAELGLLLRPTIMYTHHTQHSRQAASERQLWR